MKRPTARVLGRAALWAATLFVAYEILADSPTPDEIVAGAVIALLGALAVTRLSAVSRLRYAPRWLELRRLAGVPAAVVRDLMTVAGAILVSCLPGRRLEGRIERLAFEFGSEKSPNQATRRALVTFGISLAPNRIVCVMDGRGLVVHRLVGRTPAPRDPRWPLE